MIGIVHTPPSGHVVLMAFCSRRTSKDVNGLLRRAHCERRRKGRQPDPRAQTMSGSALSAQDKWLGLHVTLVPYL